MMPANINILCCHQSGDLYGSDKVFRAAVFAMADSGFNIIVMLASDGPLRIEFEKKNIEVKITPLGKIKRKDLTITGLLKFPFAMLLGIWQINRLVNNRDIGLVYVNTIVILSPVFWAALKKKPLVWHIHEVLDRPYWLVRIYAFLMNYLASQVVFVSKATAVNFTLHSAALEKKSKVIYNSYMDPASDTERSPSDGDLIMAKELEEMHFVKIGLVGRISWLKGHAILLDAIELVSDSVRAKISLVFVGEPPAGGEAYAEVIKKKISASSIRERIKVYSYTKSIDLVYKNIDILAVPSMEAESFGLVAVESMAHGCPVIAANNGGLREIINDHIDGLLVKPGSASELAQAIETLVENKSMRESLVQAGRVKVHKMFSQDRFRTEIQETIGNFQLTD